MSKGYVNSVIKRPSNNMEGSVLPLSKESIALLKVKHFLGKAASEDTKLHGPLPTVENIIFDVICNSVILEVAKITQGVSGPSGMDADGWRQILVSKDYGDTVNDLHKAVTSLIEKICMEEIDDSSLSSLMASRLVSLNKNPGLRSIGVGEVLQQVKGKVVMRIFSEHVTTASSDAQMCGRSSDSEVAIHAMRRMFQQKNSDAVILVDAANAFNKKSTSARH